MTKQQLRREIKDKLKGLTADVCDDKNTLVEEALFTTSEWSQAHALLVYVDLLAEAATDGIIGEAFGEEKKVFIPRVADNKLFFHAITTLSDASVISAYGIKEPPPALPEFPAGLEKGSTVLVIVPGLGYDRSKNRLGRGMGYYDGFLGGLRQCYKDFTFFFIGICYQVQLCETIPVDADDVPVDLIITEAEVIR